jgi:tagaturonate reductase
LGAGFTDWLEKANIFCNTLVDRIVPGTPDEEKQQALFDELGFTDDLFTVSEVYRLFAIEGDKQLLCKKAPFLRADESIIISKDITPYRERKLRILNGGHTISVAAGFLCGLETVYDCMQDAVMKKFITQVIHNEIVPSLDIDPTMATAFADDVLDRFRNPFLNHQLLSITLQYTSKMNMRNAPTFARYAKKTGKVPDLMCAGFATYLLFARPKKVLAGKYYGIYEDKEYLINDDRAEYLKHLWAEFDQKDRQQIENLDHKLLRD